ncbi:positive regulator of sigma E, putative [Babesia ovata]|uniref:Positive regulator of sigma E, putative n=1 Tax=Babesia ovata TaxID=189622 RepID=A0A2H6KAD9_9APIC|nr:positive regulator of sigma E, putative [Babesia ovata]GBE59964.1 positive regulator of sigma E, putative [Babesia ovata]
MSQGFEKQRALGFAEFRRFLVNLLSKCSEVVRPSSNLAKDSLSVWGGRVARGSNADFSLQGGNILIEFFADSSEGLNEGCEIGRNIGGQRFKGFSGWRNADRSDVSVDTVESAGDIILDLHEAGDGGRDSDGESRWTSSGVSDADFFGRMPRYLAAVEYVGDGCELAGDGLEGGLEGVLLRNLTKSC